MIRQDQHTTNLTQGPMSQQMFKLTFPLLVANLCQQLYNTVDALVIGYFVGETAFAAIGIAGSLMNLLIFIICGCCTGVSVILAHLFGAHAMPKFRQELYIASLSGGAATIVITILLVLNINWLLRLINTPPETIAPVKTYIEIITGGMLLTFIYNLAAATLRAAGNTSYALRFLIISIISNALLDILLVGHYHMGIAGTAWATLTAQLISVILCLYALHSKFPELLPRRRDMRPDKELLKKTISFASISGMQASSLYIGKLMVQGTVNLLGTAAIAAYTAAIRIEGFASAIGASGSEAISVFVAQNQGAHHSGRAISGFKKAMWALILTSVAIAMILYNFAQPLMQGFIGQGSVEAIRQGTAYLKIIGFFYMAGYIANVSQGWFRGTGHLSIPFASSTLQICIRVILSILFAPQYGLKAVAIATGLGWMTMILLQAYIFRQDRLKAYGKLLEEKHIAEQLPPLS